MQTRNAKPARFHNLTRPESAKKADAILMAASADPMTIPEIAKVASLNYQTTYEYVLTLAYVKSLHVVGKCGHTPLYSTRENTSGKPIICNEVRAIPTTQRIFDYVSQHGPVAVRTISHDLNMAVMTAYEHIRRLEAEGKMFILGKVRTRPYVSTRAEDADKVPGLKPIIKLEHQKVVRDKVCIDERPAPTVVHVRRDPLTAALFGAARA